MRDRQKAAKLAANEANADKYPRRKKKDERKARRERVLAREERWLTESGIARDKDWPLA